METFLLPLPEENARIARHHRSVNGTSTASARVSRTHVSSKASRK